MLNVACVKWGTAYGPEYVNNLAYMVARHLQEPYKFVCFTDDDRGIDYDYVTIGPLPGNLAGWWNKLWLFAPDTLPIGDRILYLDLDTAIIDNIDNIARCQDHFAILRDFYRPRGLGSGVMLWEAGRMNAIWESFVADDYPDLPGGDQSYIEVVAHRIWGHRLPEELFLQHLFPDAFVSYKAHCADGPPPDARIVCFHGQPKPHNCGADWIAPHWRSESTPRSSAA